MIVVEITAALNSFGATQTFYLSTDTFVTGPADIPPHTAFLPRLMDPGSLGVHAYDNASTTSGSTKLEQGDIQVANADGYLDDWLNYGFDGQTVIIRSGEAGSAYPGEFTTIFQGTADGVDASWRTLTLKLRDKQYLFDLPALTNVYLGNNALPLGIEGTSDDLKDQVKPKLLGTCFQVTPKFVNTSKLTYQVTDGALAAIHGVYDRGVPLTAGANFATSALLLASTPAAGSYNTCLAEGLFQLGAQPAGTVTADASEGPGTADRTTAQLLQRLALLAGLPSGDINLNDIFALDAVNSAVVGVWIDGSTTFLQAMDSVAASIGVWYGFDPSGQFRMGQLSVPAGPPILSLHDYDFSEDIERRAARDNNIPVWKVKLNYYKVNTVQTDLAGSVSAASRALYALEYRTVAQVDSLVQAQFKLATTLEISGALIDGIAAQAEADRQLGLQKVRRDVFEVTISVDTLVRLLPGRSLSFMDVVQLTASRFGLASGKMFRLLGITYQLATNQVSLTLWG